MNAPEASVILCTHNPNPDYLARTLDAVASQTISSDLWEFLLIDNASDRPVAEMFPASFPVPVRAITEDQLGLTPARRRGIQEARADLLIFVDDDNVLAADYVEQALAISREWPHLGAWGGQCLPDWEIEPEDWTREYWHYIGVRFVDRDLWSNHGTDLRAAPIGAGLCVRRQVANAWIDALAADPLRRALGRTGKGFSSSEDSDLALTSCDLGLGTGVFIRLTLTHLIGRNRVSESYLLKLVEGLAYSGALLLYTRGRMPPRRSRAQQLLDAYQGLFISKRAKRFERAMWAGREAASREIERIESDNGSKQ